jgi:uncharacterized membrane protein YccC
MRQRDLFRTVVGLMILASVALGTWVSPYWFLFTTFVGLNMFQSSFTRFCPLDTILKKTGLPE